ncbi:fimbrial protein [Providencia rettgeri]|uniref:fimbrial protein n=1 Tax=Providencia TaxID=586 RepID=UPI00080817F4|nr:MULTISPECIES: fimbrial protein [Providencia]ELH9584697.1 fimbrial protein [Providencia rettgeri]ELM3938047.1 fimbrial protein [Providencia rettgeri]ELR5296766.1 fimbrial protein [Providencia rettgeri]EMA4645712.1 fimbrial protein [Providencia rettgeri]EMC8780102.1 fimbrial protein [Providencia rettgeri]
MRLFFLKYGAIVLGIFIANAFASTTNPSVLMEAVIANKGVGCEITLPQTLLRFKPLQANQLKGTVQTYEIQPLMVRLACVNETQILQPKLTLQGVTPYPTDSYKVIFLDEKINGIGFMVRQTTDGKPISLADFYRPDVAIGNTTTVVSLNSLTPDNQYQSESTLWVGMVGPFQSTIIAGRFQASLMLNVIFE